MIARGFKPVGWVACVGVAAIGCYMVSLRVAAERADLTGLERRIVQTRQQIRTLEAELGTRGRLQQLEQWNDEVLALAAPAAGQFVSHDARLAQYSTISAAPLEGSAEVQMAAAPAPAPAAPAAPAAPPARHAVGSPQRAVAPAPALAQPLVQRASLTLPAPSAPSRAAPVPPRARAFATETRTAPARAAATTTTTTTPTRPRAAPVRTAEARTPPRAAPTTAPLRAGPTRTATAAPRSSAPVRAEARLSAAAPAARRPALVDERTLRDIGSASRAERRGGRRD